MSERTHAEAAAANTDWVVKNGWGAIREWIDGKPVGGARLIRELSNALAYVTGQYDPEREPER